MNSATDTIAAVATAPGAGGVGIVRVSGPKAALIAAHLLQRAPRPRYAHYCPFAEDDGRVIDDGLLLFFPAPHSFTGEHVLELQAHGSPVVLRLLLRRVCALGARPARAGEFSERAFLNGKLDLAQAEAIADLIASGSEAAARAARRSLDGEFSQRVHQLTEAVVRVRIWIEAAIDFPEEEIDFLATPQLAADLAALQQQLSQLLSAARRGVRLNDGLHVVIIGRPNAGKSSLLNAMARSDRAIVTDIPGTTRDVLRETIELDGIELTLVDTAGLRESGDQVEQEGIRRAHSELQHADLVLLVTDDSDAGADADLRKALPVETACVVIHNKIDVAQQAMRREQRDDGSHLWLSAKTGAGLDLLREELARQAGQDPAAAGAFTARARHVAALELAHEHLQAAEHALLVEAAGELAAEELRLVQHALGEITGAFSSDDLLGRIFADFCIGK